MISQAKIEQNGIEEIPASTDEYMNRVRPTSKPAVKEEVYNWPAIDKPGVFMLIHKAQLNIDPAYQREKLSHTRILALARNWSWLACGCLLAVRRTDGSFWVYDGQHRLLAARKRLSITTLPCLVFDVGGISEEARAFYEVNSNRGAMASFSSYHALLAANDPTALAIERIVSSMGYRVSAAKSANSQQTIRCVALLMAEYRTDAERMERVFRVCVAVAAGAVIKDILFSGLSVLEAHINRLKKWSLGDDPFLGKLVTLGQDAIIAEMHRRQVEIGKGGPKPAADAVRHLLTKGRNKFRIPSIYEEA